MIELHLEGIGEVIAELIGGLIEVVVGIFSDNSSSNKKKKK